MTGSNGDLIKTYEELMGRAKDLIILGSAGSIVYWDMETKMPPKGVQLRSQQLALLEKIGHRMLTDPENGRLIEAIVSHKDYDSLEPLQKRNVHLSKKQYDEATKLPEELVVETARQTAVAVNVWKKAKA
ncbi:MAG: carboxypeptidase M32, partial [Candidatus Bathyarchaeota archaeon]